MLRSPRRPGSSFCRKLTTLAASSQRNLMVKTNAMMETVIPPATKREETQEKTCWQVFAMKTRYLLVFFLLVDSLLKWRFQFDKDLWDQHFVTVKNSTITSSVYASMNSMNESPSSTHRTTRISPNSNHSNNTGLTNNVKHEVPYQEAQRHSTAKYESSRWKDKRTMQQWIIKMKTIHT